ncbi:hypothetical protein HN51_006834 [Arachis hypogaea]|uniref:Homeobox-leucine zipper protein n=1 Tax=Arachis duranensis TaxID=130453 RepID=A0A6P4DFY2_ARADU|nr:homeobox-leucine zipper protein ATHB-40 [Arachis duranensis]QHO40848.1 Homeobox-leucine zipper protein [Arachis hypogaea]
MNQRSMDEQMMLISQLYPAAGDAYTQIIAQQGENKKARRRRNKKKKGGENGGGEGNKKRKLSEEQVNLLEMNFGNEHKLESERKDKLALELGLDPRQVAVWFQNRRARWKNKKLEEEYSNLKRAHETTLLDKCRLETEVLKLNEQLSNAKEEIQRLQDMVPSNSSSSQSQSQSQSMEIMDPPFLGDYVFCVPETHYINGMEWVDPYENIW